MKTLAKWSSRTLILSRPCSTLAPGLFLCGWLIFGMQWAAHHTAQCTHIKIIYNREPFKTPFTDVSEGNVKQQWIPSKLNPEHPIVVGLLYSASSSTTEKGWQLLSHVPSDGKHTCAKRTLKGEENMSRADFLPQGRSFTFFGPVFTYTDRLTYEYAFYHTVISSLMCTWHENYHRIAFRRKHGRHFHVHICLCPLMQ